MIFSLLGRVCTGLENPNIACCDSEIIFEAVPALGRLGDDVWFGWCICIPSFVHCFTQ